MWLRAERNFGAEGIKPAFADRCVKSNHAVPEVIRTPYPSAPQRVFIAVPGELFHGRSVGIGEFEYRTVARHRVHVCRHTPSCGVGGIGHYTGDTARCIELCAR